MLKIFLKYNGMTLTDYEPKKFLFETGCYFFRAHLRLFTSQSLLQIVFQANMGRKRKELRNDAGLICLFFWHKHRILKFAHNL